MSETKFAFYCTCGSAMTGAVSPDSTSTLRAIFESRHSGAGHSATDAATARRARSRSDSKRLREDPDAA